MARFGTFIIGGLVGAVAALLYAPRKGEETRNMVAEKANEAWAEAQVWGTQAAQSAQQVYQQAAVRGQEVAADVSAKSQQVVDAASERVQAATGGVKPSFVEKNDELRDKIEAARQRIAAQVAKNAEEAAAAAAATIDTAADAAEGFVCEVKEDVVEVAEAVEESSASVDAADEQK